MDITIRKFVFAISKIKDIFFSLNIILFYYFLHSILRKEHNDLPSKSILKVLNFAANQ